MIESRALKSLEAWVGFPVDTRTNTTTIKTSDRRSDDPYNRFVFNMIIESRSISVSCIPKLIPSLSKVLSENTAEELFSDFGLVQISALVQSEMADIGTGFSYGIFALTDLKPQNHKFEIVQKNQEALPNRFECNEDGQLAGWVEVYERDDSGCQFIDVETNEKFRGRGIATALVYEATRWILENGKVARYGAEKKTNFASLRLAKRLGYKLLSQHIVG